MAYSPDVTLSFPIAYKEATPDGDLIVYGKATDGTVDADQQIVDSAWSGNALKRWLQSGGNLRVQHQAQRDPAGVGLSVEIDKDGEGNHWLRALVVEPVAKRLVASGALRAFSVGIMRPRIVHDKAARGGRIVGGELGEVSLVDRPANGNCSFSLVKSVRGQATDSGVLATRGEMSTLAGELARQAECSNPRLRAYAQRRAGQEYGAAMKGAGLGQMTTRAEELTRVAADPWISPARRLAADAALKRMS